MRLDPFFMIMGVAFIPTTVTLVILWLSARRRAEKAEAIVHELTVMPALRGEGVGHSTAQLGQAIDAIALEVERISEGQRFTTRLLSERREAGAAPSAPPPRVVTPH
jgi:GNAT superfamily N-acetyltransferase